MSQAGSATASWPSELRGRTTAGRAALWAGAGLVALMAHTGAIAWALRAQPVEMADSAPPPAIMIELAAEPEAVNTEANEISEQTEASLEVKSDTVEPVVQPTPEDIRPAEPVEKVADAEPEPVETPPPQTETDIAPVEEQVTALDNVDVPIPLPRPRRVEDKPAEKPNPPKTETARKAERKPPTPSSEASTEAAAQVRQSDRNAAPQTTAGMGLGSTSPAKWQSRLMAHLERRKRYPSGARSRREQGTAYVRFEIDDAGNVLSASLARSSGFPELDEAVLDLVRRASPVPAPPSGVNRIITAPVRFTIR